MSQKKSCINQKNCYQCLIKRKKFKKNKYKISQVLSLFQPKIAQLTFLLKIYNLVY